MTATALFAVTFQQTCLLFTSFRSYFNYRVSRFLTEKGFTETWDFFDSFTWYPLGRVVGGTMYPGACARGGVMSVV